jgi:hypothetical protein
MNPRAHLSASVPGEIHWQLGPIGQLEETCCVYPRGTCPQMILAASSPGSGVAVSNKGTSISKGKQSSDPSLGLRPTRHK